MICFFSIKRRYFDVVNISKVAKMEKGDPRASAGGKKSSRKGVPNKTSVTVRDNICEVFRKLGGVDAMHEWAKENPTIFYKIYAQMLPRNIQALDAQGNEADLPTEEILDTLTDNLLARIIAGEKIDLGKHKEKGATRH